MFSVGIDVSKGKSTVCVLKPYGEIVCSPFEVSHEEKALKSLVETLMRLAGEVRVVMEATGIYHLPVLTFLKEQGFFVSVVNPFAMKKYARDNSIRGAKTDKMDSVMIETAGPQIQTLHGTACKSPSGTNAYPRLCNAGSQG